MSDELNELKEAAERAKENKTLAPVSLTMAILAVLVATVSLLGHRAHTEEILMQTRATDQWAYYQAKNMRRNNLEAEVGRASRRADRFDLGEVFLEIALVVTYITLLTDKRAYWYFGFVLAI